MVADAGDQWLLFRSERDKCVEQMGRKSLKCAAQAFNKTTGNRSYKNRERVKVSGRDASGPKCVSFFFLC